MSTEALKSASITNRDATPQVANNAGNGAPGRLKMVDDYVTTTSGVTVGSTYRIVQVPSNARVKRLTWEAEAMTQGPFDVGVAYAFGRQDKPAGDVISAAFFASATSAASAVPAGTEITNESGTYTLDKRGKQLWDALGLSADPGGYFDIIFTSTNTITAGGKMGARAEYEGD